MLPRRSFGVEEKKSQGPNKLTTPTGKKGEKAEIGTVTIMLAA